ncbi:MAG TPA: hypothetical protein VLH15_04325 [Dehalococcoidales bacterium]|nr:hypothetical protein [Dehalococcoidales bacterium]
MSWKEYPAKAAEWGRKNPIVVIALFGGILIIFFGGRRQAAAAPAAIPGQEARVRGQAFPQALPRPAGAGAAPAGRAPIAGENPFVPWPTPIVLAPVPAVAAPAPVDVQPQVFDDAAFQKRIDAVAARAHGKDPNLPLVWRERPPAPVVAAPAPAIHAVAADDTFHHTALRFPAMDTVAQAVQRAQQERHLNEALFQQRMLDAAATARALEPAAEAVWQEAAAAQQQAQWVEAAHADFEQAYAEAVHVGGIGSE